MVWFGDAASGRTDYHEEHLRGSGIFDKFSTYAFFLYFLQIQEEQRQFPQRFARRLHQVGKASLPDEASGQNVVEIVFVLPVSVIKCLHSHHPMFFFYSIDLIKVARTSLRVIVYYDCV